MGLNLFRLLFLSGLKQDFASRPHPMKSISDRQQPCIIQPTRSAGLAKRYSTVCMLEREYYGECSEELTMLIRAADFRHSSTYYKYDQHHLDGWRSTTVCVILWDQYPLLQRTFCLEIDHTRKYCTGTVEKYAQCVGDNKDSAWNKRPNSEFSRCVNYVTAKVEDVARGAFSSEHQKQMGRCVQGVDILRSVVVNGETERRPGTRHSDSISSTQFFRRRSSRYKELYRGLKRHSTMFLVQMPLNSPRGSRVAFSEPRLCRRDRKAMLVMGFVTMVAEIGVLRCESQDCGKVRICSEAIKT
ncbi:hypothetical protein EVAR_54335_1 [Eumeta japonica]|uniref:Uncharacterized protein n=1 Tax=Eumeta variegata TaxID=151549 RepID=A0A4C1Y3N1_EUMVA|nr:hypothetical protein EVAR_54335_1 [Eumeta japonica]